MEKEHNEYCSTVLQTLFEHEMTLFQEWNNFELDLKSASKAVAPNPITHYIRTKI